MRRVALALAMTAVVASAALEAQVTVPTTLPPATRAGGNITTVAPKRASPWAVLFPIPLVPPVIRQILPCIVIIVSPSFMPGLVG